VADVKNTKVIDYPSSDLVRTLNIVLAALTVLTIAVRVLVAILQQMNKRAPAKEGLETAILISVVGTIARSLPALVREIRNLREQLAT
jgi:hypothetical protein